MSDRLYEDWTRATALLRRGNSHAAAIVLERIRDEVPGQRSVREALGRAYFNSGRPALAEAEFAALCDLEPANDYARYGLARCALLLGDAPSARGHVKVALAMNPSKEAYGRLLQRVEGRLGDDGTGGAG